MKNIVNNIFIISGICALFFFTGLTSCKKALELTPTTEYGTSNFYVNTQQANAALIGAYYQLQIAINQEFAYYGDGRTDNVTEGTGSISTNTLSVINNTLDGNLSYSNWASYYAVIKQANLIIKNVPAMRQKGVPISDADYNRILGQAYGLRALSYFYLVRVWGDVPLITEPTTNNGDIEAFKTPRVSKNVIYNLISSDLIKAKAITPTANANIQQTRGMITRGAIYALQTDFYMWRNNPDSALIASALLIKPDGTPQSSTYALTELFNPTGNYSFNNANIDNSPYSKMFTEGFSTESIFEVVYDYEEDTESNIFTIFGNNNAQFLASTKVINLFDPNDARSFAIFKNNNQIYKYFPKGSFNLTTTNDKNVIIYRLADIMLLRAEALNAKGDRDGAWTLLKKIRERAFGPVEVEKLPATVPRTILNPNSKNDIDNGATGTVERAAFFAATTAEAENILLKERQIELCFEGKRWFDLVRTGKVFEVMGPINGISDPNNIVWPIALDVIRQNPLIEQNEFYK